MINDNKEEEAKEAIKKFLDKEENYEVAFSTTQLKVVFEKQFFHWITTRALKSLEERDRLLKSESVYLKSANPTKLYVRTKKRYYKRLINKTKNVLEEYMEITQNEDIGRYCEDLVLRAFAENQFICLGSETNELNGIKWTETEHDLDFIFERDSRIYGVEVKNTLPYIGREEFDKKIKLCEYLGITPLFVVRQLPKNRIFELNNRGGFALIFKYQFFPRFFAKKAKELRERLHLPIDSPRRLDDGTMRRFLNNHHLKYT